MSESDKFNQERKENINAMKENSDLNKSGINFLRDTAEYNYSYNFDWLSLPFIQYPQDIVATQEIIWKVKPDLIIETGIARGGSLAFSASMLTLLDYCEAQESNTLIDPQKPKRKVIGIDIDIRAHNLQALESHPMRNRMELIEGSSTDSNIINQVHNISNKFNRIMVFLDSNHTHDHVLEELKAYAPLVSSGSYCVVFDSVIEDLPNNLSNKRSWLSLIHI